MEYISRISESTGFREEILEKVIHLLNILDVLNAHPYLKGKLVLKGGTALNLFIFNIPRLSVDIDLNYVGSQDRESMLEDRPKIEQAMQNVFSRAGFTTRRIPTEHAGGKWILNYQSHYRQTGVLEVDLNFMLRQPLSEVHTINSHQLGDHKASNIPVLDIHELAAGKLVALLDRNASRDLYDAHALLGSGKLNSRTLRPVFVAYVGMNRNEFREVTPDVVNFETRDLENQLVPVLSTAEVQKIEDMAEWAEDLSSTCREKLDIVLPFSGDEMEFLNALQDHGEIRPELLTDDTDLQAKIFNHPMLKWKAINVKKHKSRSGPD